MVVRYILIGLLSLLTSLQSESHGNALPLEPSEIVLIFNQPKYVAGDTAFFAASLNGFPSQIMKGKRVIGISLVDSQNEVRYYNRILFQDGNTQGQLVIPLDLSPGGYWLVAEIEGLNLEVSFKTRFTIAGKFAYPALQESDIDSLQGNFSFNAETTTRRQSVKVSFQSSEENSYERTSVSVFKESLFSEQKNEVHPTVYKLGASINNQEDLNMVKTTAPYFFKGSATFKNSGKAVPDSTQLIFYLNNSDFVYQQFTNSRGEFSFPLFKNFSDEEVFYSCYIKKERVDTIALNFATYEFTGQQITMAPTKVVDIYFQHREKLESIEESYNYFENKNGLNTKAENNWWPDVDYEVNLEKLEPFNTMEEVFQNVISLVRYKKSIDGDGLRLFLKKETQYATKDPLFMIDGTLTDNTEYFVNLDPNKVKRIGICRTPEVLARYGLLGANGIVAIETFSGSLPLTERTDKSVFITGISKPLKFIQPRIKADPRIPVLEPCLYWNPEIKPNQNGYYEFQFDTSDDLGTFIIEITSIDEAGRIYRRRKKISVTP